MPAIVIVGDRRIHEFRCNALSCKGRGKCPRIVRRYLDKKDRNSTGNLRRHARLCWGDENVLGADACGNLANARDGLSNAKKLKDGSITAAFKRTEKEIATYSNRQHDKVQIRFVHIRKSGGSGSVMREVEDADNADDADNTDNSLSSSALVLLQVLPFM